MPNLQGCRRKLSGDDTGRRIERTSKELPIGVRCGVCPASGSACSRGFGQTTSTEPWLFERLSRPWPAARPWSDSRSPSAGSRRGVHRTSPRHSRHFDLRKLRTHQRHEIRSFGARSVQLGRSSCGRSHQSGCDLQWSMRDLPLQARRRLNRGSFSAVFVTQSVAVIAGANLASRWRRVAIIHRSPRR